jgi:polyhydroxybutyrate depolymerase
MNHRTTNRAAARPGWLALLALLLATGCGGGDADDSAAAAQAERARAMSAAEAGDAEAVPGDRTTQLVTRTPNLPDAVCRRQPQRCGHTHVLRPDVNGQRRDTIVYVSWRARQVAQAPVVFMLHGTNGNGEEFYNRSGWREKADAEGLIAIFPSALRHCYFQQDGVGGTWARHLFTKWAGGKLGDPAVRPLCTAAQMSDLPLRQRLKYLRQGLADDLAFFRQQVDIATTQFNGDPHRVYASGFSNGAEMSGRLAAEATDLFAAVHCASSVVSVNTAASWPISVLHTVGNKDDEQKAMLGYGPGDTIPLTPELLHNPAYWGGVLTPFLQVLRIGPANAHAYEVINRRLTSQFLFDHSLVGASNTFRSVVVQDLEHEYPNGINHPIVMADWAWDFFRGYRRP